MHTNFSYECCFGSFSPEKAVKTTFVQKIRVHNVNETDNSGQFHQYLFAQTRCNFFGAQIWQNKAQFVDDSK